VRHWSFQLFEFVSRAMHFYTNEIGNLQQLRQRCTDIFQMSEKALGASVRFTTEDFVAVDGEAVKKIIFLSRGFLDELRKG
jgi:hypothetical protein